MKKLKLLFNPECTVSCAHYYLRPVFEQYFDIVEYDPRRDYDAKEHIIFTSIINRMPWFVHLADQGARVIYDALWEHHKAQLFPVKLLPGPGLILDCKFYFWINEHYYNISQGYQNYVPAKNIEYRALLPIRQTKPHRKRLLDKLAPCIDSILYSQVDQGKFMPNDLTEDLGTFQRHFDPQWYDSTAFTIASETVTYTKYQLHVTEKCFKPMAYYHPFVVWGQPGVLHYLQQLDFETFSNLFDETYDNELNQDLRLDMVVKNINDFDITPSYDVITWHSRTHFRICRNLTPCAWHPGRILI
jgi:hypothetical protein